VRTILNYLLVGRYLNIDATNDRPGFSLYETCDGAGIACRIEGSGITSATQPPTVAGLKRLFAWMDGERGAK
jgi:hypothetical protein